MYSHSSTRWQHAIYFVDGTLFILVARSNLFFLLCSLFTRGFHFTTDDTFNQSEEGIRTISSAVREGGVDGAPVTEGAVHGEDLFWTIHTSGQ